MALNRLVLLSALLLLLVYHVPIAYTEARQLLIWSMQPDAPYTAMTRTYLRKIAPRLANPDTPHPFIEPRDQIKRMAYLVEKYQEQLLGLE